MTDQELRISRKYYLLNFCSLTEKERKKLIYEITHFQKRLALQGKTMDCTFHVEGAFNYVVSIR